MTNPARVLKRPALLTAGATREPEAPNVDVANDSHPTIGTGGDAATAGRHGVDMGR